MATITVQEAQASLPDLLHRLAPGEEVIITENDEPLAKLVGQQTQTSGQERKLGTQAGSVLYMAPDFDAPLEDFKDYME